MTRMGPVKDADAKLLTNRSAGDNTECFFCHSSEENEAKLGLKIKKCGIAIHYFCMLFASGLSQRGKSDREGLLGFLVPDIHKESRRAGRLKCSYCKHTSATIGCVRANCRVSFHFGCGVDNGALNQFFGNFSSYCVDHRLNQDVPPDEKKKFQRKYSICVICMSQVLARPTMQTLRTPCCKANSWYHRECLQRMASCSGLHFFKCPLCNNKDIFQQEMLEYGIYIPDRDAEWELEPNAFQELLERHSQCDHPECRCPLGRNYSKPDTGWEIVLCDWCGHQGCHIRCGQLAGPEDDWVCDECVSITNASNSPVRASQEIGRPTESSNRLVTSPPHRKRKLSDFAEQLPKRRRMSMAGHRHASPKESHNDRISLRKTSGRDRHQLYSKKTLDKAKIKSSRGRNVTKGNEKPDLSYFLLGAKRNPAGSESHGNGKTQKSGENTKKAVATLDNWLKRTSKESATDTSVSLLSLAGSTSQGTSSRPDWRDTSEDSVKSFESRADRARRRGADVDFNVRDDMPHWLKLQLREDFITGKNLGVKCLNLAPQTTQHIPLSAERSFPETCLNRSAEVPTRWKRKRSLGHSPQELNPQGRPRWYKKLLDDDFLTGRNLGKNLSAYSPGLQLTPGIACRLQTTFGNPADEAVQNGRGKQSFASDHPGTVTLGHSSSTPQQTSPSESATSSKIVEAPADAPLENKKMGYWKFVQHLEDIGYKLMSTIIDRLSLYQQYLDGEFQLLTFADIRVNTEPADDREVHSPTPSLVSPNEIPDEVEEGDTCKPQPDVPESPADVDSYIHGDSVLLKGPIKKADDKEPITDEYDNHSESDTRPQLSTGVRVPAPQLNSAAGVVHTDTELPTSSGSDRERDTHTPVQVDSDTNHSLQNEPEVAIPTPQLIPPQETSMNQTSGNSGSSSQSMVQTDGEEPSSSGSKREVPDIPQTSVELNSNIHGESTLLTRSEEKEEEPNPVETTVAIPQPKSPQETSNNQTPSLSQSDKKFPDVPITSMDADSYNGDSAPKSPNEKENYEEPTPVEYVGHAEKTDTCSLLSLDAKVPTHPSSPLSHSASPPPIVFHVDDETPSLSGSSGECPAVAETLMDVDSDIQGDDASPSPNEKENDRESTPAKFDHHGAQSKTQSSTSAGITVPKRHPNSPTFPPPVMFHIDDETPSISESNRECPVVSETPDVESDIQGDNATPSPNEEESVKESTPVKFDFHAEKSKTQSSVSAGITVPKHHPNSPTFPPPVMFHIDDETPSISGSNRECPAVPEAQRDLDSESTSVKIDHHAEQRKNGSSLPVGITVLKHQPSTSQETCLSQISTNSVSPPPIVFHIDDETPSISGSNRECPAEPETPPDVSSSVHVGNTTSMSPTEKRIDEVQTPVQSVHTNQSEPCSLPSAEVTVPAPQPTSQESSQDQFSSNAGSPPEPMVDVDVGSNRECPNVPGTLTCDDDRSAKEQGLTSGHELLASVTAQSKEKTSPDHLVIESLPLPATAGKNVDNDMSEAPQSSELVTSVDALDGESHSILERDESPLSCQMVESPENMDKSATGLDTDFNSASLATPLQISIEDVRTVRPSEPIHLDIEEIATIPPVRPTPAVAKAMVVNVEEIDTINSGRSLSNPTCDSDVKLLKVVQNPKKKRCMLCGKKKRVHKPLASLDANSFISREMHEIIEID